MFEAIERFTDGIRYIFIAWGKLVAEQMQDGKIDLIGSVRIGGMNFRLDISSIVIQYIKHIVTFMLICTNDFGINGDAVGYQSVGNNPFFEPKVFRRISSIDGGKLCFKFLPVTTGM